MDHIQEHPQPGIFALWDYVMNRGYGQLRPKLQESFNMFVNQHFERDLRNLQLNRDKQNRVAKVMLLNMHKAETDIDSLNLSIWEYQKYTDKLSSLVNKREETSPTMQVTSGATRHSASYIQHVYDRLESYVTELEDQTTGHTEEIQELKSKLLEANKEIGRLDQESQRFLMENASKDKEIKSLQQDKQFLTKELQSTNKKIDELVSDKESINRKLDDVMNVMVKGMECLRTDLKSDLGEAESRMTSRLDDLQDTLDVVQETQDTVREDVTRMKKKVDTETSKKPKDKQVNLNISIRTPTIPEGDPEDDFKTISDKLRIVQGRR